ncbi:MAG: DUF3293 domain-containing protein [Gammaproteobacteria bacterium]|nr:DUF3293 domain-containing protein [Gammaproteobacteria bacterium]
MSSSSNRKVAGIRERTDSQAAGWPEKLVEAFRTAHFDILIDPRPVTLSLYGVVPCGTHRLEKRLAVVTGWNPGMSRPDHAVNEQANKRLEARLREDGLRYVPAVGRSPDRSHAEPSFAVFDLDADEARALAEDFGQAAVFCWDGKRAHLEWCRPPQESDLGTNSGA